MESETSESHIFCGASQEHVYCQEYCLSQGNPITPFGLDKVYKKATWLEMIKCTGYIDASTFLFLPNLNYISMEQCNIAEYSPKVFSLLEKLTALDIRSSKFPIEKEIFEGSKALKSLSLADFNDISGNAFEYLTNLDTISFVNCQFENLNKIKLSQLNNLKCLTLENCKISNITSDVFDGLLKLEELRINNNEIDEIDCNAILSLVNLRHLCFHDNKTHSEINYAIFQKLPVLESLLFESHIYGKLDFSAFPNLKNVQIGYGEQPNSETDEVIEKLKHMNINYELVFCGKVQFDENEMEVCC